MFATKQLEFTTLALYRMAYRILWLLLEEIMSNPQISIKNFVPGKQNLFVNCACKKNSKGSTHLAQSQAKSQHLKKSRPPLLKTENVKDCFYVDIKFQGG